MKTRILFLAAAIAASCMAAYGAKKGEIRCEGVYPLHLQGVATDGKSIFWSFTSVIVKTGLDGKFISKYEIERKAGHMGDLCCNGGKVYVGVARGEVRGCQTGDEVWEFDAAAMALLKKHPTPQTVWSNNGIEFYDGSFWIISSAPKHCRYNMVFRYTPDFRFMRCLMVDSGWTNRGVQTIFRRQDEILLGCYGTAGNVENAHKSCTLVVDGKALAEMKGPGKAPEIVPCGRRVEVGTSEGMLELGGILMAGRSIRLSPKGEKLNQRYGAKLVPVEL